MRRSCTDKQNRRVTVQAGIRLQKLNEELHTRGLAMPNLGDIAYQSIAGAISTATHGTGRDFGGIATQVVGMRIVAGDGSVIECAADESPRSSTPHASGSALSASSRP